MTELFSEFVFRLGGGPKRFLCWIWDRLTDRFGDRSFGIASSGHGKKFETNDFVSYQAVSYRDLHDSLAALRILPGDVFLDIGCGMGRALCVAATLPFRKVLGIDLSPELCRVARRNLASIQTKIRSGEAHVWEANALEYEIPPEVTVIFLFNPVRGEALHAVLNKILRSAHENPRHLRILFTGTVSAARFRVTIANNPEFLLCSDRILRTGARALLYNVQVRDDASCRDPGPGPAQELWGG